MSTIINTPDGIEYAQLAALKGAVKLESLGMRHIRIRSVRKLAAIQMGLKPNAKCDAVIVALKARMDELLAKVREQREDAEAMAVEAADKAARRAKQEQTS